jgi:hypothetical protein
MPRAWYVKMDVYLLSQHFFRCKSDPNIYMLRTSNSLLIIIIYVDDLLITRSLASKIIVVKDILHDGFYMMDMGPLHFFLGLEISRATLCINLSQTKYVRDLLVRFHITDCKLVATQFFFWSAS